jgi:hypothetical protein
VLLNVTTAPVVPTALAVSHDLSTQAGVANVEFQIHFGVPDALTTSQLSDVFLAPQVVGKSMQPATFPFTGLAETQ